MKNKVIIYLLTLAFMFTSAANIFALANDFYDVNINELDDSNPIIEEEPDTPDPEPLEDRRLETEGYDSTEAHENSVDNEELEISEEEVLDGVQGNGDKTFTVTKKPISGGEETLVGDYDTFYEAIGACKQEDLSYKYVVTMNSDYNIPETESFWGKTKVNMILKSKEGSQFTLKKSNKNFMSLYNDTNLKIENVIIDGAGAAQAFAVMGGTLTLGRGAVVQNCNEYTGFDGPAIFVSSNGILNIEKGALIQNNHSNHQGGAIQARNESTINISGGTFKNNKSNTSDGGVIAAYGTLNITGGTFEDNGAKKTSGAIIIGSRATASISNANFKGNKASTGGAIYSSKELEISNTTFENNSANYAGAIYASKGIELNNVSFDENIANKQGGAIYINKGNSTLTDCNFTKNASQAIFINHDNKGITTISKTSFTENYSNSYGGCIYLGINSKLEVSDSTFTKNEAAFGAAIASAGTGDVNNNLTNIKLESSTFTENKALMGGGIFTAFPTEIANSTFTKNQALVHPQDDKTNPHLSGVGGAIRVMDNKTTIKGTTFEGNFAGGSGGAIGINGVARDEDKNITTIKPNIKVEISDNTKFIANTCALGQGGAIYTIPYLYDIEGYETDVPIQTLKEKAYKNLSTSDDTIFKDNIALSGFVDPPADYAKYTNLAFSRNSFKDLLPEEDVAKSLLNNYDVNYKNKKLSAFFDPNGGEFKTGDNPKDIRVINEEAEKEITLLDAPKREGYKFTGWKCSMNIPEEILKALPKDALAELKNGKIYKAGDKFILDADYIFVAQWEAEEPEPKPEPYDPGYFYDPSPDYLNEKSEPERRDLDVYRWYMEGNEKNEFMPKKGITRAEMAQIFARALAYDGYKTYGDYNPYPDVDPNKWYYQAVVTTTEAGVFKGTDMGTFEPEREITQAELIATISRFQKLINKDGNAFEMKFDHWARPEVQAAYEEKWLEVYKDGRANFNADAVITREEVATILNKAFGRPIDEKYIDQILKDENDIEKNLKTFKDIDKDMWSYYEIITAANTYAVKYKDKERTDYEWYNHAIEDDGPSMPVEKVRWYNGLLNNDKYIDHLYQIKFQREMRIY